MQVTGVEEGQPSHQLEISMAPEGTFWEEFEVIRSKVEAWGAPSGGGSRRSLKALLCLTLLWPILESLRGFAGISTSELEVTWRPSGLVVKST